MNVRRIKTDEGPRLRAIRLNALADAPSAFGSSLEEEQALPSEHWTRYAQEAATSETMAIFVAEEDEHWFGLVRGFVHKDYSEIVRLVSLWVDPSRWRLGVGAMLVETVIDWARGRGAKCVQLWVTETNQAARSLYTRKRFMDTAHTKLLPSNPSLREVLMVLELI
jgi:GNAT superfamily N-acetyltransferase